MISRNPSTLDEARAFVTHVQSLFMPWDIPALLAGFTEDCVVRFGDLPEFRGKAALEELFRSRRLFNRRYRGPLFNLAWEAMVRLAARQEARGKRQEFLSHRSGRG